MINLIMFRIILILLGFYRFESSFKIFTKSNPPKKMKSGFIILSNHTSPIDIFYFMYLNSPIFNKIFIKKKEDNTEEVFNIIFMFYQKNNKKNIGSNLPIKFLLKLKIGFQFEIIFY